MRLIKPDSLFFKIPESIGLKEVYLLDAIRLSIDVSGHSYEQLVEALKNAQADMNGPVDATYVFQLAWTLVDSANRLFGVLRELDNYSQIGGFDAIFKHKDDIKKLRDCVQHLNGRLDMLVSKKLPIMGVLGWSSGSSKADIAAKFYSLTYGSESPFKYTFPAQFKKISEDAMINITLMAHERSFNLSIFMKSLELFTIELEKFLFNKFEGQSSSTREGSAYMFSVEFPLPKKLLNSEK